MKFPRRWFSALVSALVFASAVSAVAADVTGFDPAALRKMDAAIEEAIAARNCPGGVLWVEHETNTYSWAYGRRALVPVAMTEKLTLLPVTTPWLCGCVVMAGVLVTELVPTRIEKSFITAMCCALVESPN